MLMTRPTQALRSAAYDLADLVIVPSIEPTTFAPVAAEAQAMGKPVWNELDKKKALDAELEKKLTDAIGAFKSTWKPGK